MLAVETGVPRLFPLSGIFTAATPCDTIKKPVSSFGGSLHTEPFPIKPENKFRKSTKLRIQREIFICRPKWWSRCTKASGCASVCSDPSWIVLTRPAIPKLHASRCSRSSCRRRKLCCRTSAFARGSASWCTVDTACTAALVGWMSVVWISEVPLLVPF